MRNLLGFPLGLALMLFSSCTSSGDVRLNPAQFSERDAVIIIHGYYGSSLREANGGPRRWLRVGTLLAGHFRVALDSQKLGLIESPKLEVEGLLGRFSVIPGIYSTDVYGKFFEETEKSGEHQVLAFAYDWRQDLFGAVKDLDALVKKLRASGVKRIALAAHSMGGLVAAYYLGYGSQDPQSAQLNWEGAKLVQRAAFFGTPFGGSISILRNMQSGTGYPWNPQMLQAGTVASFPASYHLLPLGEAFFLSASGEKISVDLGDPEFWEKHHLGLLHDPLSPTFSNRRDYTFLQLGRARQFLKLVMQLEHAPESLRLLNAVGVGRPTLATGYFDPSTSDLLFLPGEARARGLNFAALEADGDGTVVSNAAAVPQGLARVTTTLRSEFSHDRIFMDPLVQKQFAELIKK